MEFDRIAISGASVELEYGGTTAGGADLSQKEKGSNPSSAFKAAMQAFQGYALWSISAPESWKDAITVRAVHIKRPDDSPRGIVVSLALKCPRARNSLSAINTPFLTEAPEGHANTGKGGFLPTYVHDLIDEIQELAERYSLGERGDQISMNLHESENAKAANERMAAAEVASTRKPKGKKKNPDFIPGAGDVMNPESTEPPMDDTQLHQLLLSVDRDCPVDAIARWAASDRAKAQVWGLARQKEIVGSLAADKMPAEPECVIRDATPGLSAEQWTAPTAPPKASSVTPLSVH